MKEPQQVIQKIDELTRACASLWNEVRELREILNREIGSCATMAPVEPKDLSTPIDSVEMSHRLRKTLGYMGVKTIADLANVTEHQLMRQRNFGQVSLCEVKRVAACCGVFLKPEISIRIPDGELREVK
jgi:DNA-directed RNA polymerase alpha subunit